MQHVSRLLFLCALTLVSPEAAVRAGESGFPFRPGEKLTFQVKWALIPAGEAVLQVLPMETVSGSRSHHFQMLSRTYEWVDILYKVRDRIDSFAEEDMNRSLLYTKYQQGKSKRDIVVDFDWDRLEARYSNLGKGSEPIRIAPGSFDPLGVFYSFRLATLREGLEIKASVTDGKKCVPGRARVIRREKIKVPLGECDTFLVEPALDHIGGIFEKSKDAKLQIWVSADQYRIPVRIRSEVIVGSFVAELIAFEPGSRDD